MIQLRDYQAARPNNNRYQILATTCNAARTANVVRSRLIQQGRDATSTRTPNPRSSTNGVRASKTLATSGTKRSRVHATSATTANTLLSHDRFLST